MFTGLRGSVRLNNLGVTPFKLPPFATPYTGRTALSRYRRLWRTNDENKEITREYEATNGKLFFYVKLKIGGNGPPHNLALLRMTSATRRSAQWKE
jgi:hypothetical protein